jgi:hypothetical protein
VCLNTVDNVDQFLQDINQGRWDAVLPQITHLRLPTEKLYDLYEQIVCEMIEMRETDTARAMLRTMKAFKRLQKDDAERFMRLDRMANPCDPFDPCQLCLMFEDRTQVIHITDLAFSPSHQHS